jgi:nucleoside-diphosphate-sugar epimerase
LDRTSIQEHHPTIEKRDGIEVEEMKVFVTGGSGYIGTSVIKALRAAGHQVSALSRSEGSDGYLASLGAGPVRGTLEDTEALRAAAGKADGVIHLGQVYGEDGVRIDLEAAMAMMDGVGAGPFVHTGGVWVYGDTDGVADENAPIAAPALVAWREENERAILAEAENGHRPVLVMPGLVYGDHEGLIEAFFAAEARRDGKKVPYIGDGSNRWALVHRDDIADLYVRALAAPAGSKFVGVGPVCPTAREVAEAVARSGGSFSGVDSISLAEAREAMGPIAEAFALDQRFTSAKAHDELGWAARHHDPLGELAAPPAVPTLTHS